MSSYPAQNSEIDTIAYTLSLNDALPIYLIRCILPAFLESNNGVLLVTGSALAYKANPNLTTLSVGMAGLENLVQAYTKQLESTNIHIGMLSIKKAVNEQDKKYNPHNIALQYWKLFQEMSVVGSVKVIY